MRSFAIVIPANAAVIGQRFVVGVRAIFDELHHLFVDDGLPIFGLAGTIATGTDGERRHEAKIWCRRRFEFARKRLIGNGPTLRPGKTHRFAVIFDDDIFKYQRRFGVGRHRRIGQCRDIYRWRCSASFTGAVFFATSGSDNYTAK